MEEFKGGAVHKTDKQGKVQRVGYITYSTWETKNKKRLTDEERNIHKLLTTQLYNFKPMIIEAMNNPEPIPILKPDNSVRLCWDYKLTTSTF